MSSGLLNRSTSRISKSIPFSNSTSRQRWENGQVVPEYRTIMFAFPQKAEGQRVEKPLAGSSLRWPHASLGVIT
ncbi:hypothetical protein [Burkholderia thailandensis]|uniref:hypothetical protein n=1 Tax=Burkholderia thailandensis TaxID=57975 RepID=UPI001EE44D83|nr:hypothetical protein [Burkholderia thailandensis]